MDFLRDPIWQFLGVVIAVVFSAASIVVSIIIYLKQRNLKEVTYDFSSIDLIDIKKEAKDKIQVLYNFKPISDAELVIVKIWNSGNQPILLSDYEETFSFLFGGKAEVLAYEVVETNPKNLRSKVNVKVQNNKLIIDPLLLNRNVHIVMKVILSKFSGSVEVNALISGVEKIRKAGTPITNRLYKMLLLFAFWQIGIASYNLMLSGLVLIFYPGKHDMDLGIYNIIFPLTIMLSFWMIKWVEHSELKTSQRLEKYF